MLPRWCVSRLWDHDGLAVVAGEESFIDAVHAAGVTGAVGDVVDVLSNEVNGTVGENKARAAARMEAAEALGELIGVVGQVINRGAARCKNVVHAIALLALNAARPGRSLVA